MSDSISRLPARPSLDQLRKQSKELLRQFRAGDESARKRFAAANPHTRPVSLADAQFVIARESGFDSWTSLKRHVEALWRARIAPYQSFAEDLAAVFQSGDAQALDRIHEILGRHPSVEQLRAEALRRVAAVSAPAPDDSSLSQADARLVVARIYGFAAWSDLEASIVQPRSKGTPAIHGVSATPPFYRIRWNDRSIEPRPPLSANDWEEIFEVMRDHRLTGLHAAGQMTDTVLARLAELDLVTALHLDSSWRVTDEGVKHLAAMSRLEILNLSGCDIGDQGLSVLRQLPSLREFYLYHHSGVSDTGLANLAFCQKLERVDLLGSHAGDGVLRALTGKPKLRHFKSGNRVTDAGLPLLHEFPVFKTWHGGNPEFSLMSFHAEPNHLLLRGQITDRGMADLAGLDGLFSLNLDDARLAITAAGLKTLAALPNLNCFGFDATDETMGAIVSLPRLRMLMCQDTSAGDSGFEILSNSRTLEYLWGRRCYNLAGRGFRALARMPSLRGLSVSCKNVDDAALSSLPDFPALVEFMPMDVPDEGFRHIGECHRLEALWCMYCRETGDAATAHLSDLPQLKTYYAGQTRITDRSLQILSHMQSIERLILSACASVTDAGIAMLGALPRLRELSLESMPRVTRQAITAIPAHVQLNFET